MSETQRVAEAFRAACRDELESPKPGNVHLFAPGHRMKAQDFLDSAEAAAPSIAARDLTVGARILGAIRATQARVGQNTNLGIVLLCAPLAQAALHHSSEPLQTGVARVLAELTREDADFAFKAIARANPGGLGTAPQHDVRAPARANLLDAMRAAEERDRIAYQYANDFTDIFGLGRATLREARRENCGKTLTTLRVYLSFLTAFPDSHIARKFGPETATQLMREARDFVATFGPNAREGVAAAAALRWDSVLKQRGLNPGTSADLTVATLFAEYLAAGLANAGKNG